MTSKKKKASPHYALLALPIPVNTIFTYSIPSEFAVSAESGCRALVPFGKRLLTGFIVGISDKPGDVPVAKIKPIHDIIDDEPVFDNHMLEFSTWISSYYLCSLGDVLKTAMPHGTMVKSRIRIHLSAKVFEKKIAINLSINCGRFHSVTERPSKRSSRYCHSIRQHIIENSGTFI